MTACQDSPEAHVVPEASAPEISEADARASAYARLLADYPEAATLVDEESVFATPMVERLKGRQISFRPRSRALFHATDGIRAYVSELVAGNEPSPALLDAMWDLGRKWPSDFPELAR